ncbi:hypothetical protein [Paenibacillus flagellatus]|uniref:Uncharacterized protein n=1 Tax=Paenibacillus flagellatus TaxID=2211139 RepID=A0A2V5KA28_9BACL|nr:hypothetical protein [Paenibacillus flagellatus]PYI50680.1 hypothetical protein DLM86_28330 [Paenibacillus flagellatus]
MTRTARSIWRRPGSPISSVTVGGDSSVYASSLGQGVYRISPAGEWTCLEEGWPGGAVVNRLQMSGGVPYACTSKGLYAYRHAGWEAEDIAVPAYRLREGEAGRMIAATQYGIWCKTADGWLSWAYPEAVVYDVLYLPQFIVAGREGGLSLYDRLTGEWTDYRLAASVTGLAVFRGKLIGTGDRGQLIVGNGRGAFDVFGLGGLFVIGLIPRGRDVYACTDRGLFRLGGAGGRLTLLPVKLGFPVADADWVGDRMVLAALFGGIRSL